MSSVKDAIQATAREIELHRDQQTTLIEFTRRLIKIQNGLYSSSDVAAYMTDYRFCHIIQDIRPESGNIRDDAALIFRPPVPMRDIQITTLAGILSAKYSPKADDGQAAAIAGPGPAAQVAAGAALIAPMGEGGAGGFGPTEVERLQALIGPAHTTEQAALIHWEAMRRETALAEAKYAEARAAKLEITEKLNKAIVAEADAKKRKRDQA